MVKWINKAGTFLREKIGTSLGFVILAALLLELLSFVQFYHTRSLLRDELQKRMEKELSVKAGVIRSSLASAEMTMQEHLWDMQVHLSQPDSMFSVTRRLIAANPEIVGGCMAFLPDYYPQKGRFFEPYASKENGVIRVQQLGGQEHDYTEHPAFREAMQTGQPGWSDPYLYGTDSVSHLTTYSYPLRDGEDKIAAVCGLDLDLSWLRDTLNASLGYPSSFGLLMTRSGETVIGPDGEKPGIRKISALVSGRPAPGQCLMTRFRDPQTRRKGSVYYTSLSEAPYWQVALVSYDREVFEPIVRMWRLSRLLILCGLLILFFIINRYVRSARRLQQARIEQARIGSELGIARSIQMEMLPKPLAERPDLDIHGFLVPAREVGGDLYDFFLQDGKLFFCIGDVSGKGVPSAMVMSKIQSLFRRISAHVSDPARIVQVLNEEACRGNERNMFITFFAGVLNLSSGHLQYCNAGHDRPFLLRGKTEKLQARPHLPLGVFPDTPYGVQEVELSGPATLFLYTDGVTEAMNPRRELFTDGRLAAVLEGLGDGLAAREMAETVSDAVRNFVGDADPSDDLTLLVIRYIPQEGVDILRDSIDLDNDVRQVSALNHFIRSVASRMGMAEKPARNLQLAVEEIVVNVMHYAYPPGETGRVHVEATSDGRMVRITVSDEGVAFDPTAVAEVDTTRSAEDRPVGGLGVHLARHLADSIHYERVGEQNVLTLTKMIHKNDRI